MDTRDSVDPVPLLNVVRQNQPLREEMLEAVARVIDSGRFLHGPEVDQLEQSVADLCQVSHGIGCASGSDALLLALMACGIQPGDEVIVPSFTFFATASAVWRLGARPIFADIDPRTFNLDVELTAQAVTDRTRAIIPVHLFGQPARMDAFRQLAHDRGLWVIEDAAQAIGAAYRKRPVGSWGNIGCFSFYPTKNLGGCGDGGMLTTNSDEVADRLRLLAAHGMRPRYYHQVVGINSRLDTIQAALLGVKFQRLAEATRQRQANAQRYAQLFRDAGLDEAVQLPHADPAADHVWNQFTIRVPGGRRDGLRQHLLDQQIGCEIYYPVPLHQQACFRDLALTCELPETVRAAAEVLSLPISAELELDDQIRVVEAVGSFFHRGRAAA